MTNALSPSDVLAAVPTQLFIGGRWQPAEDDKRLTVLDPATELPLCEVADASPADGLRALAAADAAQEAWAAHPPRARSEILTRTFEALLAREHELALLMTLEMGKPLAESRSEVRYAAEFFRWFAEEAVRIDGGYATAPDGSGRILVARQPVGPCLLITPWNFPSAMAARKIGPAVAAGCTMVLKPASNTPLSALALAQIMADAGLPDGVLNVLTSSSSSALMGPLIRDPRARKLSFTGSTAVGRQLIRESADQVLRVSMELGGNAPFLVFEDADLDAAVEGAMLAKLRNNGEACTAANRFYVHERVAAEFTSRLAERFDALRLGHGADDADLGPLIDAAQRDAVAELVEDAIACGARVVTASRTLPDRGFFHPPVVLADVPDAARAMQEEIFGPVAPIQSFSDEDAAVAAANRTQDGLVGYVFTRDLDRALRVSERLQTGMVGLNRGIVSTPAAPFGGIKHSGVGREGGREGIAEYLETKYVALRA